MSDFAHDPIPRTGYGRIRSLERNVVGSRKSPICGKPGKARVSEVAADQGSHIVQFLLGGVVLLGVLICQQFRPSHSGLLSQNACAPSRRLSGSDHATSPSHETLPENRPWHSLPSLGVAPPCAVKKTGPQDQFCRRPSNLRRSSLVLGFAPLSRIQKHIGFCPRTAPESAPESESVLRFLK
jgi:hypothetical protein